jgi:hypothetical protein
LRVSTASHHRIPHTQEKRIGEHLTPDALSVASSTAMGLCSSKSMLKMTSSSDVICDVRSTVDLPTKAATCQQNGGGLLSSREFEALAAITALCSQLAHLGLNLDPPKVALVGGQGSGKSSILNVLLAQVGSIARFPSKHGTCTKLPIVLTLKRGSHAAACVTVEGGGESTTLPNSATSDDVLAAIEAAQSHILRKEHGDDYDDDPRSPKHTRFSSSPIVLTAVAPYVATEVVLIDLPGLVAGEQSSAVEAIVRAHTEQPSTLLVVCSKSDNDVQTCPGLALAASPGIDPACVRTVRLQTFYHQARKEVQDEIKASIAASTDPATTPHVLDLQMSASGSGVHLVEALPIAGVPSDVQGMASFLRRCTDKLGPLIRGSKASLKQQLSRAADATAERLDGIGRAPPTEAEVYERQVLPLFRLLHARTDAILRQSMPRDGSINLNTALQVFQADLAQHGGDRISELDIEYWNINQYEPKLFQGEGELHSVVERIMKRWPAPFARLLDSLRTVYQSALLVPVVSPTAPAASTEALFTTMDTDRDGVISLDEMRTHLKERAAAASGLFDRIDTNGDGVLSREELHAYVASQGSAALMPPEHESISASPAPSSSLLDRPGVPERLKQLIAKRWSQIIDAQVKLLAQHMVPCDEARAELGVAPSQLEKMMHTPPPHDLLSDESDFGLTADEIKRRMRTWPAEAHVNLKELATRCGYTYDADALRQREDYSPPGVVLRVANTRIKIRQEAQDWIGCEHHGQLSGRMLGFVTQVRDQIHNGHRAYEDFVVRDQLRTGADSALVLECFEDEWQKHAEERSKLLEMDELITKVRDLVEQL